MASGLLLCLLLEALDFPLPLHIAGQLGLPLLLGEHGRLVRLLCLRGLRSLAKLDVYLAHLGLLHGRGRA